MNNRSNVGEAALGSPKSMISLGLDASQIPRGLDGPAVAHTVMGTVQGDNSVLRTSK
jgi:hypothetical protein